MPITILAPKPAPVARSFGGAHGGGIDHDDSDSGYDDGDVDMAGVERAAKRRRTGQSKLVTPGEIVTDDTQWMR